jgi:hypothetical protein
VDDAHGIVTAVKTTTGRINEGHELMGLIDQHQANGGISAYTIIADCKYGTIENYVACQSRKLEAFKVAAAGLRGPNPAPLDTEQWWSLGRHFDLVTALLDWTYSPFIAAFFPLWEVFSDPLQPSGAIFWSDSEIAVYRLFHNEQLEGEGLRVIKPTVDELGRMHGQRGLFT